MELPWLEMLRLRNGCSRRALTFVLATRMTKALSCLRYNEATCHLQRSYMKPLQALVMTTPLMAKVI
jgi:hypothetical protein